MNGMKASGPPGSLPGSAGFATNHAVLRAVTLLAITIGLAVAAERTIFTISTQTGIGLTALCGLIVVAVILAHAAPVTASGMSGSFALEPVNRSVASHANALVEARLAMYAPTAHGIPEQDPALLSLPPAGRGGEGRARQSSTAAAA